MSLGVSVLLALVVIVAYWAVMLGAVWIGWKLAMSAVQRRFGTTDPFYLLELIAAKIRGKGKS